ASHDLQEPLRKIQSFNSLILEHENHCLTDSAKHYFGRSMAAAERMRELIKDLIDYSRTNAANWEFESVDLNDLLREVKEDLSELISEKAAIINASHLPTVSVIKFMFRQLFQNLISNSLKYQQPDLSPVVMVIYQRVEPDFISSKASDEMHQLSFSDNGIGFDQSYSKRIFQLFQRLHGRSEYSGTGIGLAICHRIMQNHNGTITAEGSLNNGATFIMKWPVTQAHSLN
ncbi:MAG: histidine kinase, partial [Rudanella sp.]|nr:histidine kinase [Rudanella sp.]